MPARSHEVEDAILDLYSEDVIRSISSLYSIHCMVDDSFPHADFTASKGWASAIKPSEHALEIISQLGPEIETISKDDISLALLINFYHTDFLIDIHNSNIQAAEEMLKLEFKRSNLRLPERFGRTLYDRFNDSNWIDPLENLDPNQVDTLLGDTETGIYQVGTLTIGPLGPLHSRDKRFVPPIRQLPLWHCNDTGCGQLHTVNLEQHASTPYAFARRLSRIALDTQGDPADWFHALANLSCHPGPQRNRPYYDLPALIADCIPHSERKNVLAEALRGKLGQPLRQALSQSTHTSLKGSPENITNNLSAMAQMQLLLTLNDRELVTLLDACIYNKIIKIPPTETRTSKLAPPRLSNFYETSIICMFGVRTNTDHPTILLSNSIWDEYERIGQTEDLSWRCRRDAGNHAIDSSGPLEYMINHSPRDLVKNLILPSRPVTLSLLDKLQIQVFNDEPEDHMIDRILWKFGFDPPRYDLKYGRIKLQLRQLRDEVLRHRSKLSEDDRDAIRSRGVNVFVALENIFEELISYNVWLLSSDHFVETKFKYSYREAVSKVADVLGESFKSSDIETHWKRQGGNVFSTLLVYARLAADWMASLENKSRTNIERPADEMPHYTGHISQQFRFRHRELWADSAPSRLREFADSFGELVSDFEKSRLAEVRNGLDHYRNEDMFPALDVIIACEARLSAVVERCDINRFFPKYFWMKQKTINSFGMTETTVVDYAENKLTVRTPQPLVGLLTPGPKYPIIIPFGNLLGSINSDLVFRPEDDSEYSKMWNKYPRRHQTTTSLRDAAGDLQQDQAE